MKTSILFLLLFLTTYTSGAQNENLKEIKGKITYQDAPLKDVNIVIKGTIIGTKTNALGEYSIQAKINDQIQYSYSGFQPVTILVEDVTSILNIEMDNYVTALDEIVVETTAENNFTKMDFNSLIKTADISYNPMVLKEVRQFSPEDIQRQYGLLSDGLKLYYPKGLPTENFDLDGELFIGERMVDLHKILNVYFIPDAFNYYKGFLEPVENKSIIVIRTTDSKEYKELISEKYKNQNFYNNDAIFLEENDTLIDTTLENKNNGDLRIISGKVTYIDEPISDVNIVIKGTTKGVKTNRRGNYTITANIGDVLQFSHIAYKTVNIIVEDITKELDIEMITHTNELDEVVIIAKTTEGKVLKYTKKAEQEFSTSRGIIDPKTAGFAIGYIDGAEISNTYPNIQEALRGKISGYTYDMVNDKAYLRGLGSSVNQDYPAAWEVDGVFTTETPVALDLSQIVNIYVLKSLASTNKYGSQAAGGVIVINTKSGDFWKKTNVGKLSEHYTNKNLYNNDAIDIGNANSSQNPYSKTLESFNDKQEAFAYYNNELSKEINEYYNHIAIASTFINFYKDSDLGLKILTDLTKTYSDNPEVLKALAYQMQAMGKNINAVELYEDIFLLRPKYAQSYRDLANAYLETDQFKKSWRLFMRYLMQGYNIDNISIGDIMYNEMEYLYFLRKDRAEIKEQFVPKSKNLNDFRVDIRIVFEWNTSEAEFEFEFVSPDFRSYVFEHSLAYDEELITDEKLRGYSSKEFIIDEMGDGKWLVNLTYNGNKKNEPTYFKVTQYYNWGKSNQSKKVKVYELNPDQNQKLQLLKLDKQVLIVNN